MQSQALHGARLPYEPDGALEEKVFHVEVGTFQTLIVHVYLAVMASLQDILCFFFWRNCCEVLTFLQTFYILISHQTKYFLCEINV